MRTHLAIGWGFLLIFVSLLSCKTEEREKTLLIAAASNLQFVMEEIAAQFSEETGVPCELIIGSSGKLTAQIIEGAPYHVLVAADRKYPEAVLKAGKGQRPPEVYAYGQLVLWSINEDQPLDMNALKSSMFDHLAIANPRNAPYGIAAQQTLEYYGLWEEVQPKVVFGESVAQTNQFITSGAADMGFTALSVVLSENWENKGSWRKINTDAYAPIEQCVIALQQRSTMDTIADHFQRFLHSEEAQTLLKKYGYSLPEE